VPYLSALEVCSRQGAIQIRVYLTLPYYTCSVTFLLPPKLLPRILAHPRRHILVIESRPCCVISPSSDWLITGFISANHHSFGHVRRSSITANYRLLCPVRDGINGLAICLNPHLPAAATEELISARRQRIAIGLICDACELRCTSKL